MSFRRPGGSEKCAARDDAPGLPKVPAAEKIDVDENGKITGLFQDSFSNSRRSSGGCFLS